MSDTHDVSFEIDEAPAASDLDRLRDGLTEHARSFVDRPGFVPLAVFARDESGEILAGVYGHLNWNWLDVSLLWVAQELRGQRLGARLLRRLEEEARERGCRRAHVDTFSYQARGFYESSGYVLFAELEDYPPGHARLFLRKDLDA